jgi:hypothetical protein
MLQPDGAAGGVLDQATVWVTLDDAPKGPLAITLYVAVVAVEYSDPESVHDCSVELVHAPPPTVQAQLVAPEQLATSVMGLPICAALGPTIVQTGAPVAAQMLPAVPAAT